LAKADRNVRMQIMLQPEELAAIEDWRFARRMPSRASAVRELLHRGLAAEGFNLAEVGKRSSSFGVTNTADTNARRRGKKRDES
jgi:hypothetical protein